MFFFAARQPILNPDKSLFAYELLFRDSPKNQFPGIDHDVATSRIVDGMLSSFELDTLLQGQIAFINFTASSIINELPFTLAKDRIVIEILETSAPSDALFQAVKRLHQEGYRLALDDYRFSTNWERFLPFISIVKVETPYLEQQEINAIIEQTKAYPNIRLLAEKIETHDQFNHAKALGFRFFQGYFFCHPEVIRTRFLGYSSSALLQVIKEVNDDNVSARNIAKACEGDLRLSLKLLRYVNSAMFRRVSEISSIKQAVTFLGRNELRRFVYLLFTTQASSGKSLELIRVSLIRARFCEGCLLKAGLKAQADPAFLAGMLSVVDAIFDTDMRQSLQELNLASSLIDTIIERTGHIGQSLKLIEELEQAKWDEAKAVQNALRLDNKTVQQLYLDALNWSNVRLSILSTNQYQAIDSTSQG